MRLWEKLSENTYRILARRYLKAWEKSGIDLTLRRSREILDPVSLKEVENYIAESQTKKGGFADRGGEPDMYYSLFGCLLADAMGMKSILPAVREYSDIKLTVEKLNTLHLQCAAIISAVTATDQKQKNALKYKFAACFNPPVDKQSSYSDFITLLSSYYLGDYRSMLKSARRIESADMDVEVPCSVTAAQLVIRRVYGRDTRKTESRLLAFYDGRGAFRAVSNAPAGDLLSTAVALYALRFSGCDLRIIRPACLEYIDSLYIGGGFSANYAEPETDIEYTFYGLLALGSLTD